MKKANTKLSERKTVMDLHYDEIEKDSVITGTLSCTACPYVVFGRYGECRCLNDQYDQCVFRRDSNEED